MGEDESLPLAPLMPHLGFTLNGIVASCSLKTNLVGVLLCMHFFTFLLNVLKFAFSHYLCSKTWAGTKKLEIFVTQLTGNGLNFWCASFEFCLIYKQTSWTNL